MVDGNAVTAWVLLQADALGRLGVVDPIVMHDAVVVRDGKSISATSIIDPESSAPVAAPRPPMRDRPCPRRTAP